MKSFKSFFAALGLAAAMALPGTANAVSLNSVVVTDPPEITGGSAFVQIVGGAFAGITGLPTSHTFTGGPLPGALQGVTFSVPTGDLVFLSIPNNPGGFLLTGNLLDSSLSGSTLDLLFGTTGGTLAPDLGNLFVMSFTAPAPFVDGINRGVSYSIASTTPIPGPLGIITLGSALGLLVVARKRRHA